MADHLIIALIEDNARLRSLMCQVTDPEIPVTSANVWRLRRNDIHVDDETAAFLRSVLEPKAAVAR